MSNIPAGSYTGKATGEVEFTSSNSGGEGIAVRYEITDDGNSGELNGRQVTMFGSFSTPKSTEIVFRQLRDSGWTGDSLTDIGPHTDLGSTEVKIQVQYQEWQGKERMRVNIWPLDGGSMVRDEKKLDDARKRALAERLRGAVLQSKRPGAAPPSGRQAAAPSWASRAATASAGTATAPREPWNDPGYVEEGSSGGAGADDIPF